MTSDIRVLYGFFCELLRAESSGQVTAIGLWGSECRIAASLPASLPSLSFHAFVLNPDQAPVKARLKLEIPGSPSPDPVEMDLISKQGNVGHAINFTMLNVPVLAPAMARMTLELIAETTITKIFEMNIRSMAPGQP